VPIAPGTKLGQYEVQDFIGQGAMGLVYRAYHPQLERTGAVKVMQALAPDPDSVARFRHEALAIAQMRHPNIVNVYDFGEFQGTPYMIVEYVPGGSLANRMSEGILDRKTAIKYLRGIAAGLDYAHGHGVVHRDVKPANVLLAADDSPVLADFGLAKLLQGSSLKSMSGMTTGTPAYMAPEQVTGSQVGPPADRYSLATIAYEMLTGYIPFDGEALMELLYSQVHREPPLPSSRDASLGPRVDGVIMRGLAKDPEARWDSCADFVDALAAALVAGPVPAVAHTMVMAPPLASTVPVAGLAVAERVAAPTRFPTMAMPYSSPPAGAAPLQKRRPRMGLRLLIAAGLIVALLLVLVIVWAAALPPTTMSLSSSTVVAGDAVVVSADHAPANQSGEIQLFSQPHTFSFRADGNGHVAVDILVPRDIGTGDHLVKICWSGTCHAQQTLTVIARVVQVTPSALPPPTATAHPTPTPSATVSPTPAPYITTDSISISKGFTVVLHFIGGGTWGINVIDTTTSKAYPAGVASVPSGSTYYALHFSTPSGVAATHRAYVSACTSGGRCYQTGALVVGS